MSPPGSPVRSSSPMATSWIPPWSSRRDEAALAFRARRSLAKARNHGRPDFGPGDLGCAARFDADLRRALLAVDGRQRGEFGAARLAGTRVELRGGAESRQARGEPARGPPGV